MQPGLLINIILFIGAAQGFLLAAALTTIPRGNKKANRILALLLLIFSVIIFFHSLEEMRHSNIHGRESHSGQILLLLIAPLLYYYTKILTTAGFVFLKRDLLHLIPFAVMPVLYAALPGQAGRGVTAVSPDSIFLCLIPVQMTLYLYISILRLKHFSKEIRNSFSYVDQINLSWLKFLIICNAVIWPSAFLVEILKKNPRDFDVVWILVSVLIYLIGYRGLKQPEIFTGILQNNPPAEDGERKKYEHSGLEPEYVDVIFARLKEHMAASKPYLEYNLTLPALAGQLSVSTHHLSQVINAKTGQNFFEFVNSYRVEEAGRLLRDPEKNNYTVAAIGLEAGFNSISSFNSVFKKIAGVTPSQYRNSAEQV